MSGRALDDRSVGALRDRFREALLRPGEEGYKEARRIWNGAIDRRPALIARCALQNQRRAPLQRHPS